MYIVLDSNIWIAELGLKSGRGSATRLFIREQSAILAIPEVIRMETEAHIRDELKNYIGNIQDSHSKLLTIFGQLKEITLPDDDEIKEVVENIFKNLEVPIEDIPFSFESAKDSFRKIINEQAPSDRNQQFKDGVIWSDCMNLLEKKDVHFVTDDKHFFKGQDKNTGQVAKNLLDEIKEKSNEFKIHSELASLLESIKTEIEIDPQELLKNFIDEYEDKVQNILDNVSYSLGEISSNAIKTYATLSSKIVYVDFILEITCSPIEEDERSNGTLIIKGDAIYDHSNRQFTEIKRLGEEFKFTHADGTEGYSKNVVMRAGPIVIGHRNVEHNIKYEL